MNNALDIQRGILAETIRKLRVSKQLTQRDLACMAGVAQEDIDKIEHGVPLQLGTKLKILRILYANRLFPSEQSG